VTDYTVGDTLHIAFTTRAFATGIPTVLAGSPVVSAYEDASLTQITAGITLGVSHDSVAGFNMLTIVASGANGYEAGKDYNLVVTVGTVDSVSVVGEVVGRFTLGRSAAAVDLANSTDGLGAIKAVADSILVDTGTTLDDLVDDLESRLGTPSDLGSGATVAANLVDMAGATFSSATDSQEAIRNRGDAEWTTGAGGTPPELLQATTIATLASQTSFTLTDGSADDDAYKDCTAVITDVATATQKCFGHIAGYVGSTKTVTLTTDPGVFTIATTDNIDIIAPSSALALSAAAAAFAAINVHIDLFTTNTGNLLATAEPGSIAEQLDTLIQAIKTITDALPDSGALTSIAQEATLDTAQTAIDALPSAADVNAQCDTALADYDGPTKAELDAAVAPLALEASVQTIDGFLDTEIAAILEDTATTIPALIAAGSIDPDTVVPEAFSTDGQNPTLAEILHEIRQGVLDYSVSGTTLTIKNMAGSAAATFTLDSATNPTSRTRAT
jgi:hypothetical protein